MAYFNECPHCGACLDPGEECECVQKRKIRQQQKQDTDTRISILQEADYIQPQFQFCN